MSDKSKMSVDEILAACRSEVSSGGDSQPAPPAADKPATAPAKVSAKSKPETSKPASKEGMSVADILAAARSSDSDSTSDAKPAATPSGDKPSGKKASEMSVAEMLAAARGDGGGTAAESKPKAKPASKAAPKGKTSVDKQSPDKPARTGPMDTSSILAAARSAVKPGPMSKAEAAAKSKNGDAKPTAKAAPVLPPMPTKPAYATAKPKAKADAAGENRRGFMSVFFGSFLAVGFTALGLTNILWSLGVARFMFPNILIEPPNEFKVGFPGDFSIGFVTTKFKAEFGVWVTNIEYEGQQQIVALKTVCTHLGCTPNWLEAEQKFKCPCHGSGFYKDGINFEGPAPRPLERYAIRVADDGQLEIDKSKTFQEQLGQWADPASFVPV